MKAEPFWRFLNKLKNAPVNISMSIHISVCKHATTVKPFNVLP
jgi:hypothetical protein